MLLILILATEIFPKAMFDWTLPFWF